MEKFKEIYNIECTTAINEGWEGFSIDEDVFVEFYDRNEKIMQDTMKYQIEEFTETVGDGEFDYYCKVYVAIEYLFKNLGISGFYNEYGVCYDELELID